MLLYEFSDDDPLRVKLTAVTSQLKSRMDDKNSKEPMSTNALLNILNGEGISLSKSDLFDMIKKDPLKNIIQNINNDEVIFKGHTHDNEVIDHDAAEKTVQQMAKRAASK
jgi:hypothetical protein